MQSKCTVLTRACDYIVELKDINAQLVDSLREADRLGAAADSESGGTAAGEEGERGGGEAREELLRQCEVLEAENQLFLSQLHAHGLAPPPACLAPPTSKQEPA